MLPECPIAPPWLLECGRTEDEPFDLDDIMSAPPPVGARDDTLTQVAGSLSSLVRRGKIDIDVAMVRFHEWVQTFPAALHEQTDWLAEAERKFDYFQAKDEDKPIYLPPAGVERSPEHERALRVREGAPLRVSDVTARAVDWFWPGYIPFNALTIIDGDPGVSKSLLVTDLVATLTTGRPFYGCEEREYKPANALLVSYEDGIAETIRPRLEVAGADITRVFAYSLSTIPAFPRDTKRLVEAVLDTEVRLVVIDPLMASLSSDFSANIDQEIREAMRGIIAMAEAYRVAVILTRHLNKTTGKSLYRGSGSTGIAGMCRAGFIIRQGETPETRVLRCYKANYARLPAPLGYEIIAGVWPRIEWLGPAVPQGVEDEVTPAVRAALGKLHPQTIAELARATSHSESAIRRRLFAMQDARQTPHGWELCLPTTPVEDRHRRRLPPPRRHQGGLHRPPVVAEEGGEEKEEPEAEGI